MISKFYRASTLGLRVKKKDNVAKMSKNVRFSETVLNKMTLIMAGLLNPTAVGRDSKMSPTSTWGLKIKFLVLRLSMNMSHLCK